LTAIREFSRTKACLRTFSTRRVCRGTDLFIHPTRTRPHLIVKKTRNASLKPLSIPLVMSGAGDRNRLSTLGAALGIVAGAVAATFLAVVTYRAFETPRTVNHISSAGSSGGMTPNGDKMDSSKPSEPVSEPVPVEEPMSEPASSAAHRNPLYKPLSGIPELLFGAGIFSGSYGDLESDPAATVRRALYLGITFFDTSVLYGESESILGEALQKNAAEHPREKYYIATKCGRYGYKTSDCDFTGKRTRESVMRSLERLRTSYLDIVYAHDVEFAPSLEAVLGEGGILLELFKMKVRRLAMIPSDF